MRINGGSTPLSEEPLPAADLVILITIKMRRMGILLGMTKYNIIMGSLPIKRRLGTTRRKLGAIPILRRRHVSTMNTIQ